MKIQKSMQDLMKESYLSGGADAYLDDLYETYLKTPQNLTAEWRQYFDNLSQQTSQQVKEVSHADIRDYFKKLAKHPSAKAVGAGSEAPRNHKQEKIIELIFAYRNWGHLQANIDPLGLRSGIDNPTLELSYYGFTENDLDTVYDVGSYTGLKKNSATLREIYQSLRTTYCGTIGIEYMHMQQLEEVAWVQQRMEQDESRFSVSRDEKLRILNWLIAADGLEKYLGNKYVGHKRFSLEGGDSLIPMLDTIMSRGARDGIREIVIGMAHRGRLNVLANVVGKKSETIFAAFEGKGIDESSSGDVKYHLGFSSNVKTKNGPLHLALSFNPSHLEIVSPVVQGSVRSRQRRRRDTARKLVMPIQIHGDAAFSGQGVVMETFNMSQARWFSVGGSMHIVINNQIGFTISNPQDARSSLYCTDVAKMVSPPILHINANDPEAVVFATQLAVDYRNKFKKDVVLDLVCYRRHGHNETDEPSATQPMMYKAIKAQLPACTLYAKKLIAEGVIDDKTEQQLADNYRKLLDEGKSAVELDEGNTAYEYGNAWEPFIGKDWRISVNTGVPLKKLIILSNQLDVLPEGFVVQPQVKKMLEARQKMSAGQLPLNWGYAETMAYATLLDEGYPIRLCGQDVGRGTFAHRHAVLHDQNTDQTYIPLSHLAPNQVQINIVDSLLSEEAVLAFEYGFASAEPSNLVIWEAQFGDFANGAQVVIDQFISSGDQKWGRLCGLVMLLPHGYDGMGPEHSSARLERYLQLCAQKNMQVCVPTTPAQIFHLLRRQMVRPFRKPLIVMSPKSLLRHPLAVSGLDDLTKGEYQLIIPEVDEMDSKIVDRVILCCGKVYYDLLEKRRELNLSHCAIIRLEQLYPFPDEELSAVLESYKQVKNITWCQEEPENQGAWYSIQHHIRACLGKDQTLEYAGREASASPAVGYLSVHLRQQAELVKQALNIQ